MTRHTPAIPMAAFVERLAQEVARHADDLADFERNFEGIATTATASHVTGTWHFTALQALDRVVQTSRTLAALTTIASQACTDGTGSVAIAQLDDLPLAAVRARMTGTPPAIESPVTEFFT